MSDVMEIVQNEDGTFSAYDAVVIIVQTMWKQEITVQGKR